VHAFRAESAPVAITEGRFLADFRSSITHQKKSHQSGRNCRHELHPSRCKPSRLAGAVRQQAALVKSPEAHQFALDELAGVLRAQGVIDDDELADLIEQADVAYQWAWRNSLALNSMCLT